MPAGKVSDIGGAEKCARLLYHSIFTFNTPLEVGDSWLKAVSERSMILPST